MKTLSALVTIVLLVVLAAMQAVSAKNYDFSVVNCPPFQYHGQRDEFQKPFQTTGTFGRVVFHQYTTSVLIQDWCETKGQGLIHPDYVRLVWEYQNTKNMKAGDIVSGIATIDYETDEILSVEPYQGLVPSGISLAYRLLHIDQYESGKRIPTAERLVEGSISTFIQFTDGTIYQTVPHK